MSKELLPGVRTMALSYMMDNGLIDNTLKLDLNRYAPDARRSGDPWEGFGDALDPSKREYFEQAGGGGAEASGTPPAGDPPSGLGTNEIRGTIDPNEPPVAGGPAEQPGTRALPDAQQRPEKLPTVNSKIPEQVESNPEMGRFPDVKRSEWTPDGKLRLVVDELPQRKLTPNELKYYGAKYGEWPGRAFGAFGGAVGGYERGYKLGSTTGNPQAGLALGILGGGAGFVGGAVTGSEVGSQAVQGAIRLFNPDIDVRRYGDLEFKADK